MMATGTDPKLSFEQFVCELAELAQVSSDEVSRESRLVEDLGLDSLALLEVLALLDEAFATSSDAVVDELEGGGWAAVTAGELFEHCQQWR